jgi:hypothetical protein
MYLDSQQSAFRVEIPRAFIPQHIQDKYKPYHERLPNIIQSIPELINHTIQSITIPSKSKIRRITATAALKPSQHWK